MAQPCEKPPSTMRSGGMPLDSQAEISDSMYATVACSPASSSLGASSGRSAGKGEKDDGVYHAVVIASADSLAFGITQWTYGSLWLDWNWSATAVRRGGER